MSDVPEPYVQYCPECKRYFDAREGCAIDVRFDEINKIVNTLRLKGFEEAAVLVEARLEELDRIAETSRNA